MGANNKYAEMIAGANNEVSVDAATGVTVVGGATAWSLKVGAAVLLSGIAGTVTVGVQGTDAPAVEYSTTFGTATFGDYVGWTVSTAHKVWQRGYNYNAVAQIDASDTAWAEGIEINYDVSGVGTGPWLDEWNWNWIAVGGGTQRRPFAVGMDRATAIGTVGIAGSLYKYTATGVIHGSWLDTGELGVGTQAAAGSAFTLTQPIATSGNPHLFDATGAAHTGLAANNNINDVYLNLGRTVQFTGGSGHPFQYAIAISPPTYAHTVAQAIDIAATVAILGAPAAGNLTTYTGNENYALYVTADGLTGNYSIKSDGAIWSNHVSGIKLGRTYGVTINAQSATMWQISPFGATKTIGISQYFFIDGVDGAGAPQPMARLNSLGLGNATTYEGLTIANEYAATVVWKEQYSPVFYAGGGAWDDDNAAARYMGFSQQSYCRSGNLPYVDYVIGGHYSTTTTRGTVNEIVRYRYQNGGTPALAIGEFGAAPAGQMADIGACPTLTDAPITADALRDEIVTVLQPWLESLRTFARAHGRMA